MPSPEAFHIGPFQIGGLTIDYSVRWYGIIIMLGVIVAAYWSYREARRRGQDPDHVWNLFPFVLIMGVVGARAGWVIANLNNPIFKNPWELIATWHGGLSIQGAVIGGAVAVILYCWRARLSFFEWADIIVPGVALAQAIGRWGNYANQEAFGGPTTLPWGIPISVDRQIAVTGREYGVNVRFHPTFAYEMIWDLLNFGILTWLGRQKRFRLLEGDLLWIYMIVYSLGRFAVESLRLDSATVEGVKTPQVVALITIVVALGAYIYRHRPGTTTRLAVVNLPDGERIRLTHAAAATRPSRVRRVPTFTTASTVDSSEAPKAGSEL